ncbi:MAG: M15 family metallopeptidase [Mycobacterium sp.]
MVIARRLLVATLVVACGAGCAGRGADSPSPTASSESTAVVTSSAGAPPVASSTTPAVPPVSDQARAAGLVDIRTVVPGAIVDLRYATSNNFVGTPLYPPDARCLVHESMAPGLAAAAQALRPQGEVLVFWDCYRPHDVQVRMFEAFPQPGWVATPGPYSRSHEAGRSVDVTIASAGAQCAPAQRVNGLCLVDMGTDFDDFTPRAHAFATDGVTAEAQANRARLREAMNPGGLTVYSGEWWHFDGPDAYVERPILDVPIN